VSALILLALGIVVYVATRPAATTPSTPTPTPVTPPPKPAPGEPPAEPPKMTIPDLDMPKVPAGDPYTTPITEWSAIDPKHLQLPEQLVALGLSRPAAKGGLASATLAHEAGGRAAVTLRIVGPITVDHSMYSVRVEQIVGATGTNARPPIGVAFAVGRTGFLVVG
jgi:hypothetical protein